MRLCEAFAAVSYVAGTMLRTWRMRASELNCRSQPHILQILQKMLTCAQAALAAGCSILMPYSSQHDHELPHAGCGTHTPGRTSILV